MFSVCLPVTSLSAAAIAVGTSTTLRRLMEAGRRGCDRRLHSGLPDPAICATCSVSRIATTRLHEARERLKACSHFSIWFAACSSTIPAFVSLPRRHSTTASSNPLRPSLPPSFPLPQRCCSPFVPNGRLPERTGRCHRRRSCVCAMPNTTILHRLSSFRSLLLVRSLQRYLGVIRPGLQWFDFVFVRFFTF